MHRVVRPFPVSWDGLTLVDLIVGDERDFGEMTAGLLADGYIEAVVKAPEPAFEPTSEPTSEPTPVTDEPAAADVVDVEPNPATRRPYKKRN